MSAEKWDKRYRKIAKDVAAWSKEKEAHRKVGAVIVKDNRIISTGFNGFPTGVIDTDARLNTKLIKQEMVVHAEINALIVAGRESKGATLYVHGKPVCARCAAAIIQAGITRVVAPHPLTEKEVDEKKSVKAKSDEKKEVEPGTIDWEWSGRVAREMFEETHVAFHPYARCDKKGANSSVEENVKQLNEVKKKLAGSK